MVTVVSLKNVIPETENDYPMLTMQNLRGMSQEVKNMLSHMINSINKLY
jgi:hypothetical protein